MYQFAHVAETLKQIKGSPTVIVRNDPIRVPKNEDTVVETGPKTCETNLAKLEENGYIKRYSCLWCKITPS